MTTNDVKITTSDEQMTGYLPCPATNRRIQPCWCCMSCSASTTTSAASRAASPRTATPRSRRISTPSARDSVRAVSARPSVLCAAARAGPLATSRRHDPGWPTMIRSTAHASPWPDSASAEASPSSPPPAPTSEPPPASMVPSRAKRRRSRAAARSSPPTARTTAVSSDKRASARTPHAARRRARSQHLPQRRTLLHESSQWACPRSSSALHPSTWATTSRRQRPPGSKCSTSSPNTSAQPTPKRRPNLSFQPLRPSFQSHNPSFQAPPGISPPSQQRNPHPTAARSSA